MDSDQLNILLNKEIKLIHSILEKTNLNMDLFSLIDQVLFEMLQNFPYNKANLGIINENNKVVFHDVYTRLFPDIKIEEKNFLQQYFETEIDYMTNPMWTCVSIKEDKEYYYSDISVEEMPEETRKFFQIVGDRSFYILPIKQGQTIYGSLYLAHKEPVYLCEEEKSYIRRIGSLICKIIDSYRTYQKIKMQNQQFEIELQLASRIQNEIIPKNNPKNNQIQIDSTYIPMLKVGGDYYDFIQPSKHDQNNFGFLIADVSGHGVPAAFITSMLKISFHSEEIKKSYHSPVKVLQLINNAILNKTAGNFITAFYAYFDLKESIIKYSSAGHNPFFKIELEKGKVDEFSTKGKFLGVFDSLNLEEKEIQLKKNQLFIFYTDGLTEAIDIQANQFENKLFEILKKNCQLPIKDLSHLIVKELETFVDYKQKKEFDDDVALVLMRINE